MSETIFHKIIKKEIPAKIVFEDDLVIAFRDINPVSSTHILLVPKETIPSLNDVNSGHKEILGHIMVIAAKLAQEEGIAEDGYRVVVNSGRNGGQTVFQLHFHLVGGRHFSWPPG